LSFKLNLFCVDYPNPLESYYSISILVEVQQILAPKTVKVGRYMYCESETTN